MAGLKLWTHGLQNPAPITRRTWCVEAVENGRGVQCLASSQNHGEKKRRRETPQLLKIAVSGVTELLRLFSSSDQTTSRESDKPREELLVSSIDDVVTILQRDYRNAYFVTGIFCSEIYTEDCVFEDPTIRFQGRELYSRNLKLLVPFFDSPSIGLKEINKNITSNPNYVVATWNLRTYLKLPWRPLIRINGSTVYELDQNLRIVRHTESWSVSAFEAIGQIFTPS